MEFYNIFVWENGRGLVEHKKAIGQDSVDEAVRRAAEEAHRRKIMERSGR